MKIKILKIILLILGFSCLISSLFMKNHFYIVASSLLTMYILWVFRKWKLIGKGIEFNRRSFASTDIFLFLFLILFLRLYKIQIIDHEKYKLSVKKQIEKTYTYEGKRGSILTSLGSELAYDSYIYNVSIDPMRLSEKSELEEILEVLYEALGVPVKNQLSPDQMRKLGEKSRYRLVSDKVNEIEKNKLIEGIKEEKEGGELEYKYGLKGNEIIIRESKKRLYSQRELYKDIVGIVGYPSEGVGLIGINGIEKQYEEYLKGQTLKLKNNFARGKSYALPTAKESLILSPSGNNVHLTIDEDIQYIFNDEIKKQFEATNSQEAYGIVMNPKNGYILAISSFRKNDKVIKNPIFQNQIEPGSIFKPLVVAKAMDEGYIDEESVFDLKNGTITKYRHTIKEVSRMLKGEKNVREILAHSSNVGMVQISDYLTDEKMEEYLISYGLYDKTGVDFPYEIKPFTVPSKKWDGLKRNTISFGQGVAVTPIQMVTAFSSLVNGGILYKPTLVEKITDVNNEYIIRRNIPEKVRQTLSTETSEKMKELLEYVVEEGGGEKAKLEGYRIAGKTGTAQISGGKSGYLKNNYLTSFIGAFPANSPDYVALITFYKPQAKRIYGGTIAAPVFKDFIQRLTLIKKMVANDAQKIEIDMAKEKKEKVIFYEKQEKFINMPDIEGMTLREVTNIFKGDKINLNVQGVGRVKEFFPTKDTPLENIDKIEIILE